MRLEKKDIGCIREFFFFIVIFEYKFYSFKVNKYNEIFWKGILVEFFCR